MRKPTNTDNLYPDCFGMLDAEEEKRIEKTVKVVVRVLTTAIAVAMCAAAWWAYRRYVG